MLRRVSEKPLYHRITDDIRARIRRGEWSIGAMLPSRKALAAEYGVNLLTLQHAIAPLLVDGTLQAMDRRGTFVAKLPEADDAQGNGYEVAPVGERTLNTTVAISAQPRTIGIIAHCDVDAISVNQHRVQGNPVVDLLEAVEHACALRGDLSEFFNVAQSAHTNNPWYEALVSMHAKRVDGVVVIDVSGFMGDSALSDVVAFARGHQLPVVQIRLDEAPGTLPHVFYDQRSAGYQAAEHLLQVGYRSICFLTPFTSPWIAARMEGAHLAVRQYGLPQEAFVCYRDLDTAPGMPDEPPALLNQRLPLEGRQVFHEAVRQQVLTFDQEPVGVIAPDDMFAYGMMEAAEELGLVLGVQYGIVGFDDYPGARERGLSTLRPPCTSMGEQAMQLLDQQSQGDKSVTQLRLQSQLIVRRSTRGEQVVRSMASVATTPSSLVE